MNYSTAIFLISDEVRAVLVTYEKYKDAEVEKANAYTFKTMDQTLKPGDYVVTQTDTRHNMTVCKVIEVDVEPDFDCSYEMKWIIGKVEKADFDTLKKLEDDAITKIRRAEKRKKREELRKDLVALDDDEIAKLELYDIPEEAPTDEDLKAT